MDFLIGLFFIPFNMTVFVLKYMFALVLWYGVYKFVVELWGAYGRPILDMKRTKTKGSQLNIDDYDNY
jgi:hypothetical protein|tara:strand:+ start:459 stop:662 length:204 start_codon:yes stop_codon:yes gene_type:complete